MSNKIIKSSGIGLCRLILSIFVVLLPMTLSAQNSDGLELIRDITVTPANSGAGEFTTYQIDFEINKTAHSDLKNSSLMFTFPDGFDISKAGPVEIFRDDDQSPLKIVKIEISGPNLTVHFGILSGDSEQIVIVDPPADTVDHSYRVTIGNIQNSFQPGEYLISMLAIKKNKNILFGPSLSEPFTISPGQISEIIVTPSSDTTLLVGEKIYFAAEAFDSLGNKIESIDFVWSLDPAMDNIGFLSGSLFSATTSGVGRVSASFNNSTGYSGIITIRDTVSFLPEIQIISLTAVAPNAPRVNVNQPFQIVAELMNISNVSIPMVQLSLYSEGPFDYEPLSVINNLEAGQIAIVTYEINSYDITDIAGSFFLEILTPNLNHAAPIDNLELVSVEIPAEIFLDYNLIGAPDFVIDQGNHFDIDIVLTNLGEAEATDAQYRLIVTGLDQDGADTVIGQFPVNKHFDFSYTSPIFDTVVTIDFTLTELPIDKNNTLTAPINMTSFNFEIAVISIEADLTVERELIGNNLVLPERLEDIFELTLTNNSIIEQSSIEMKSITLNIRTDLEGTPLLSLVNRMTTGFYYNDILLTEVIETPDQLIFEFNSFIIFPQESESIIFVIEFLDYFDTEFEIELHKENIQAVFYDGPNAGIPVKVTSPNSSTILVSEKLVIKQPSLKGSFLVSDNPFSPYESPVTLSYELSEPSDVEFRILSLTGEVVFSYDYQKGEQGGREGENLISWDGRNSKGDFVLNGVYIAYLKVNSTGLDARIKIAVVK